MCFQPIAKEARVPANPSLSPTVQNADFDVVAATCYKDHLNVCVIEMAAGQGDLLYAFVSLFIKGNVCCLDVLWPEVKSQNNAHV